MSLGVETGITLLFNKWRCSVTKHNIRVTKEMTPAFSNITGGAKFLGDFKAFDGKAASYHWVSLTSLLVGNCLDAKYWNFLA